MCYINESFDLGFMLTFCVVVHIMWRIIIVGHIYCGMLFQSDGIRKPLLDVKVLMAVHVLHL